MKGNFITITFEERRRDGDGVNAGFGRHCGCTALHGDEARGLRGNGSAVGLGVALENPGVELQVKDMKETLNRQRNNRNE
ncbi:hypothetical protein V6N13_071665 [Hibiscus sabdariffa]